MITPPRILIANAYPASERRNLEAAGCSDPAQLYVELLQTLMPGISCDIIYPADFGFQRPSEYILGQYDGLVWTGSSLTIHRPDERVLRQIELAQTAYAVGLPQFGSSWGIQLAVVAAGGRCAPNPKGQETCFARKVMLTVDGQHHPMFKGKPPVFDALTYHSDEVLDLPLGAVCLATNGFTRVQAIAVQHEKGSFWAVQYRPECHLLELARLLAAHKTSLIEDGRFTDYIDAGSYITELENLYLEPERMDIAWRLGIDDDILNPAIRWTEVQNWLNHEVCLLQEKRTPFSSNIDSSISSACSLW